MKNASNQASLRRGTSTKQPPKNSKAVVEKFRFYDFNIFVAVIFVATFGATIIFSSNGDKKEFIQHAAFMAGGVAGMFLLQKIDYKIWQKIPSWVYWMLAAGAILLLKSPIQHSSHGAVRWIKVFGVTIQMSEVAKLFMTLYLAKLLAEHFVSLTKVLSVMSVWIRVSVIAGMILIISSNLSSCLILLMVTFCMTYITSDKKSFHIGTLVVLGAMVVFLCYLLLQNMPTQDQLDVINETNHQIVRVYAWLNPDRYPKYSFQTTQGMYAIGSGGLFGAGLGNSRQIRILPEASNDMIFCVLCEQLGLFGAIMLLSLYVYLFYQIMQVAMRAKTVFGRYLCAGTFFFFAFQTMVNLAVVTGIIPNTGVTLPFISSGGSALLVAFAQIGLVLSVYQHDVLDEEMPRKKKRKSKRKGKN